MSTRFDAIVVGAGPAGSTAAIRLAEAGWSVALVEQRAFPRRKVCGECIAATNLPLLDALGVGDVFAAIAGPELRRVGLFVGDREIESPLPPLLQPRHLWGRALGREHLDTLLLERARALGATVLQPFKVVRIQRDGQGHVCEVTSQAAGETVQLRAPILIEAHGSWEPDPASADPPATARHRHRGSDLLAFKGTYRHARIEPGLLPVLAFSGGYGGMVLGDHGLTTLAFCIRRDALRTRRTDAPGLPAAQAALAYLEAHCSGVRRALVGAECVDRWLAVGPLQPGVRDPWRSIAGTFAVGNVAGEAHPILGEGISMAIQSSWLLCDLLLAEPRRLRGDAVSRADVSQLGQRYASAWRRNFAPRIRFAAVCAQLAMRPHLARPLLPLLARWPTLLTSAARVAGKVRPLATAHGRPVSTIHPTGVQG